MNRNRLVLVLMILIIVMTGFCQAQQSWTKEIVASGHYIAGFSPDSLQLDNNGMPVMVYGGDGLYFARFDGTSWSVDVLDQSPLVAQDSYLRFDANNDAHIVYRDWHYDWDKFGLKYLYQKDGYWQKGNFPDLEYAGPLFSMDLDSSGRPWVIFFDEQNDVVEIMNSDGAGGWNSETLFMSIVPLISLELAMEGDLPRFAYASGAPDETVLRMGYKTATGYEYAGIDLTPGAGRYLDIEVDTAGFVHMSYKNTVEDALYYVKTDPGGWPGAPVVVASAGTNVGNYASLDLDASNRPIISYILGSDKTVNTARFDGVVWTFDTVVTSLDIPEYTSLVYADSDMISICYLEDRTLKCVRFDGSTTDITTVDVTRRLTQPSCTVMNSAGNPSIMYRDQFGGYLYLVKPHGSGWRSMQLPDIEISVRGASMDIDDATGYPAVSWFSTATDHLMYMEQTATGWNVETVDTNDLYYANISELRVDSQGVPHLLYTTEVPSLRYATRTGSAWVISEVFNTEVGHPKIVIDHMGNRHLVFLDTTVALKYGFSSDGVTWDIQTLKDTISTFSIPAIQVDAAGNPHIMYPDPDDALLTHYWYENSMWNSETVTNDNLGYEAKTDYLIDSTNTHWVAWNDMSTFKIKVGYRSNGVWQEMTVDTRTIEAGDLRLAIDPLNRVSLSYADALNGDIYYAQLRNDIWYDIGMPSVFFGTGTRFEVTRKIHNTTAQDLTADEYFFLDVYGEYWFAPGWTQEGQSMVTSAPADGVDFEEPFDFTWPSGTGSATGIRFWGGIVSPGTGNLIDYDMVEFAWQE